MTRNLDALLAEVLRLPEGARARLARSLIESLDRGGEEVAPEDARRAWLAEAERRAAEIDAGVVTTRPAAEVFCAARERLADARARRAATGD